MGKQVLLVRDHRDRERVREAAELEGALQYPPASVGQDAQPSLPAKTVPQLVFPAAHRVRPEPRPVQPSTVLALSRTPRAGSLRHLRCRNRGAPARLHPQMAAQCKGVADSLEEAGDRLFTFTRLPVSQ